MGKDRCIEKEIELEATAPQVWEAIATGPGLRAWFGPLDVEPREGGLVTVSIGEFVDESAVVKVWNPPKQFATEADGHSFEYLINERTNGPSTLRLTHSGYFGEDDTQLVMASEGWDTYLHTLAQYLKYFPEQPAVYIAAEGPPSSAGDFAWQMLRTGLGLSQTAVEGDTVRITPDGIGPIDGVLDYDRPACLGIRSSGALYRFHNRAILGMSVGIGHHFYAGDVDRMQTVHAWQSWLNGLFLPSC